MPILDRLFLAHPRTVGESYLEHCAFAFRIGSRLLLAGSAALVHAAVPCLCETTASRIILAMNADIVARRARAEPGRQPGAGQRAAVRVRRIHLTSLFC